MSLVPELAQREHEVRLAVKKTASREPARRRRGRESVVLAHGPPVPHRVALPVRAVGLEEIVGHVDDVDDRRRVAARQHPLDHRVVLVGTVGGNAAVDDGTAGELAQPGRERLALLDAETEGLRVADQEDLVPARRRQIAAARSVAVDPDVRDRIAAERDALGGARTQADTETRVRNVEVHVRERATIADPEGAFRDRRPDDQPRHHLTCATGDQPS